MILTKKIQRDFTLANETLFEWLRDHGATPMGRYKDTKIHSPSGLELSVAHAPITRYPGLNKSPRWHGPWLYTRFTNPSAALAAGFDCNRSGKWNYAEREDITADEWLYVCIERIGKRVLCLSWDAMDQAKAIIDGSYLWPRDCREVGGFARFIAAWHLSERHTTAKLRKEISLCRLQGSVAARDGNDLTLRNMQAMELVRQSAVTLRESTLDVDGKWIPR